MRRLGALGLLALLGYGLVLLVGAALHSNGTSAQSGPATSTTSATGGSQPVATDPATTDPGPTTTVGVHTPHVATAANKAVLYIAGDSDAGAFGPYLKSLMDATGIVTTKLDYKVSSGLARPDFYDWPAHFASALGQVNPDIVVVTFGGNDAQGLANRDGTFIVGQPTGKGDDKWKAEYGKRVGAAMDQLLAGGRTLIWVGIPNAATEADTTRLQVQDQVVRAEAAKRSKVVFVDTWKRFAGVDGGYAEYVTDPRDGIGKDVRAKDGFHLNENGAEILALDISDAIKSVLRAQGATVT